MQAWIYNCPRGADENGDVDCQVRWLGRGLFRLRVVLDSEGLIEDIRLMIDVVKAYTKGEYRGIPVGINLKKGIDIRKLDRIIAQSIL